MAAEFIIHIWDKDKFGEDVLRVLFHNTIGHKFGAEFLDGWNVGEHIEQEQIIKDKYGETPFTIVSKTPQYDCGETSALKANLFDDNRYLYGLDAYYDLMNNSPLLIDKEFLAKAKELDKDLHKFLKKYKGKQAFHVLW